jgi:hypothetical protein
MGKTMILPLLDFSACFMKFLTMPSGRPLPMTKRYPFDCEHVVCEHELRKITIKTPKNKAKTFLISISFQKIPKLKLQSNYKAYSIQAHRTKNLKLRTNARPQIIFTFPTPSKSSNIFDYLYHIFKRLRAFVADSRLFLIIFNHFCDTQAQHPLRFSPKNPSR